MIELQVATLQLAIILNIVVAMTTSTLNSILFTARIFRENANGSYVKDEELRQDLILRYEPMRRPPRGV